jgi:hypothetical protein
MCVYPGRKILYLSRGMNRCIHPGEVYTPEGKRCINPKEKKRFVHHTKSENGKSVWGWGAVYLSTIKRTGYPSW